MPHTPLWAALKAADIPTALAHLAPHLPPNPVGSGGLDPLIAACPPALRDHLATLLLDLLTGYPDRLLGAPVLIHTIHSYDTPPGLLQVALPTRGLESRRAVPAGVLVGGSGSHLPEGAGDGGGGLRFAGWLANDARLPVDVAALPGVAAEVGKPSCVVALFECGAADWDALEMGELRGDVWAEWWAELLGDLPVGVFMSAECLLPYPAALEAARVMAGALGAAGEATGPGVGAGVYLDRATVAWAQAAGALFRAQVEEQQCGARVAGVGAGLAGTGWGDADRI